MRQSRPEGEEKRTSSFRDILLQDFFLLDTAVEKDGAPGARTVAQGLPVFPHFVTGPPGQLKRRTYFFMGTIEDIPARGQHHQVPKAGQGESPIVDQAVDLVDLSDIKIGIEPVVGVLLP